MLAFFRGIRRGVRGSTRPIGMMPGQVAEDPRDGRRVTGGASARSEKQIKVDRGFRRPVSRRRGSRRLQSEGLSAANRPQPFAQGHQRRGARALRALAARSPATRGESPESIGAGIVRVRTRRGPAANARSVARQPVCRGRRGRARLPVGHHGDFADHPATGRGRRIVRPAARAGRMDRQLRRTRSRRA